MESITPERDFAVVRYLPTNTTHLFRCARGSGPEDGSLYGFSSACGRTIDDIDQWNEEPGNLELTCGACKRAAAPEHRAVLV